MLVFLVFIILLGLTVINDSGFTKFIAKSYEDWLVDGIGLFFQGILIPILQMTVIFHLYEYLLADMTRINLHPVFAFGLSFIFVDYLYYWNHRLFHSPWLWNLHQLHHTVTEMDVLGTSRNTIWTSFLIVYLWVHPLFLYLLEDPTWYIVGVSLTSALDLWRHSSLTFAPTSVIYRCLSPWLILPQDHAWHHASSGIHGNYSANLKIWDRMHGTNYKSSQFPDSLGIQTKLSLRQKLVSPF